MKQKGTIIIGAGPYGLSIAAHLKAAGIPYRIYGTPLESWRSFMPDGMYLRSEPFASNLWDPARKFTYARFCAAMKLPYVPFGKPVSLNLFIEYADWFRKQAVGEVRDIRVTRLRQNADGGFTAELSDGTRDEASQVVMATGHMAFSAVPPELSALPESTCMHSARIKDVKRYAGTQVTIIGAGQSALETAALVREAGARVRLLVRKPKVSWNPPSSKVDRSLWEKIRKPEAGLGGGWAILAISELPRVFRWKYSAEKRHKFVAKSWGPTGARWLRERVEGQVEVLTSHRLRSAEQTASGIRLEVEGPEGVKELRTDHVIAATGFKVDLARVNYLDPELRNRIAHEGPSAPLISARFETSVPGLYLVGMATAPTFGPVMRFMFGGKHAAPIITRHIQMKTHPVLGMVFGAKGIGSLGKAVTG